MVELLPESTDKALAFRTSDKLHDEDYKKFVPLVEAAVARQGKARLLAELHDFHGWDLHAVWEDIKFASEHCRDIERVAIVGERRWESWMAKVCKPFTMAKIKYFDVSALPAARAWLSEA